MRHIVLFPLIVGLVCSCSGEDIGTISDGPLYVNKHRVIKDAGADVKDASVPDATKDAVADVYVNDSAVDAGSFYPLTPPDNTQGWLSTVSNKIYWNGSIWMGRGANIPDTRKCWGTNTATQEWITSAQANLIINAATHSYNSCSNGVQSGWQSNFVRLTLGTYVSDAGDFIKDAAYRQNVINIVNNLATKRVGPNHDRPVYVEISIWHDPSMPPNEVPTTATTGPTSGSSITMQQLWEDISSVFYNYPYVVYGISNEPNTVSNEQAAWQRYDDVVNAIRTKETYWSQQFGQATPNNHIIAVQGLNNWARDIAFFTGSGETMGPNVVYEVHCYNSQSDFSSLWETPSLSIPVIICEFGPDGTYMTQADIQPMMNAAEQYQVPYMGWYFQTDDCSPGMLSTENLGTGCIDVAPTTWGSSLKNQLASH